MHYKNTIPVQSQAKKGRGGVINIHKINKKRHSTYVGLQSVVFSWSVSISIKLEEDTIKKHPLFYIKGDIE